MPTILKDFQVLANISGKYELIADIRDNYQRLVEIDANVKCCGIKIAIGASNGSKNAGIYGVHIW